MREFCLIHLSDLHIDINEDSNEKMIRKGIKCDIEKMIKDYNLSIDSIAITGDIINKANHNSYELAEKTIKGILDAAKVTQDKLIIVPGNHDIPRDEIIVGVLKNCSSEIIKQKEFISSGWNYIEPRFNYYKKFIEKMMPDAKDKILYGFGVTELTTDNAKVRFNLLNTAWSTQGSEDYNKIYIGRWQLEYVRKQIENFSESDLTITLSHHPFRWMITEDAEMVNDYLFNTKKIGTDVLLHGHVHNAKLNVMGTPNKKILELISGIGYPEKKEDIAGQPKIDKCRYSIYKFNIDDKYVDCICRISTNNGEFVPDNSLYTSEKQDGTYRLSWKDDNNIFLEEDGCTANKEIEFDPVPVAAGWCGREDELKVLCRCDLSAVLISGVGGQGKTALASEFLRSFSRNSNKQFETCLWVDCRELPDTFHLKILQLLEVVSGGKESVVLYKDEEIADTIARFYGHIRSKKLLIVFDNIDAYVNFEKEELVGEFKYLLDIVLEREHNSKVVMTCRIPISDHRANFKAIKLEGFKEPEGIEYFKRRDIKLDDEGELEYCKKIIKLTKGHPWWIGLIIGQISANGGGLRNYMETNGTHMLSGTTQLKEYFDEIWVKLGKNKIEILGQNIVRNLVEASKPLTADEICSLDKATSFQKAKKVLELLKKLNLLEAHEDTSTRDTFYQVHPLVREFIHSNYSVEKQRPFVCNILKLYVDIKIINAIFYRIEELSDDFNGFKNVKDLIYSIDTCINSRNYPEAFALIVQYYRTIRDKGYHQDFISLSHRILNEIDWEKEQIVKVRRKAEFLSNLINTVDIIDNGDKSNAYIRKYSSLVEKNTIPYSGLLCTLADREWASGDYNAAIEHINEFEVMKQKHSDLWDFLTILNIKGLVLREKGDTIAALNIFSAQGESSSTLGNIARCLQMQGDNIEALKKLKLSLTLLLKEEDLTSRTNCGYAYLWIAEGMQKLNHNRYANMFLHLCKTKWEEYAPGLIPKIKELCSLVPDAKVDNIELESKKLLHEFLNNNSFLDQMDID